MDDEGDDRGLIGAISLLMGLGMLMLFIGLALFFYTKDLEWFDLATTGGGCLAIGIILIIWVWYLRFTKNKSERWYE